LGHNSFKILLLGNLENSEWASKRKTECITVYDCVGVVGNSKTFTAVEADNTALLSLCRHWNGCHSTVSVLNTCHLLFYKVYFQCSNAVGLGFGKGIWSAYISIRTITKCLFCWRLA